MAKHILSILGTIALLLLGSASAQQRDTEHSQFLPQPNYPRQAAMECTQGEVLVRFIVSDTFEPSEVEIIRSEPENVFDQVVIDALDKWVINADPGSEREELFEFKIASCD